MFQGARKHHQDNIRLETHFTWETLLMVIVEPICSKYSGNVSWSYEHYGLNSVHFLAIVFNDESTDHISVVRQSRCRATDSLGVVAGFLGRATELRLFSKHIAILEPSVMLRDCAVWPLGMNQLKLWEMWATRKETEMLPRLCPGHMCHPLLNRRSS